MTVRSSGILLPVFSLPSRFGIGDLGPAAYAFADLLKETRQRIWQILPLNPTESGHGHSPYASPSAFALNSWTISPEMMVRDGWLRQEDIQKTPQFHSDRVVYHQVLRYKTRLFAAAFKNFKSGKPGHAYDAFCSDNAAWLDDYALFAALKTRFKDGTWNQWPKEIRLRRPGAMKFYATELAQEIQRIKFLQFIAYAQWQRLKKYCNERCIHIFGDLPIYVPYDSADVWSARHLFKLDSENSPFAVSGVPPDYFSKTGQRWGHPVYDWKAHQKTGFAWWFDRIAHNLRLYDLVRIDHFRGLVAYWEIPAEEKTAINGKWVEVPVRDFFDRMMQRFVNPPIIAEDLGEITPDVREIMAHYGFPGMRLLVFAFSGDLSENTNTFHNISQNAVVYTGTHDTNTVRGWFENELSAPDKKQLFAYLGRKATKKDISWELIRLALMSRADLAVIPMQDLLGLGAESRLNRPSKARSNWQWRVSDTQLAGFPKKQFSDAVRIYGRS